MRSGLVINSASEGDENRNDVDDSDRGNDEFDRISPLLPLLPLPPPRPKSSAPRRAARLEAARTSLTTWRMRNKPMFLTARAFLPDKVLKAMSASTQVRSIEDMQTTFNWAYTARFGQDILNQLARSDRWYAKGIQQKKDEEAARRRDEAEAKQREKDAEKQRKAEEKRREKEEREAHNQAEKAAKAALRTAEKELRLLKAADAKAAAQRDREAKKRAGASFSVKPIIPETPQTAPPTGMASSGSTHSFKVCSSSFTFTHDSDLYPTDYTNWACIY